MNLFEKISLLPDELIQYIKMYLHITTIYQLNKINFEKYFPDILIIYRFPYLAYYNFIGNSAENYIKKILRNDNDYIFKFILLKFGYSWKLRIKHKYKNKVFKRYLDYVSHLCIEKYKSTNCRNKIYEILGNEFKTNNIKNINNTWNN